MNNYFKNKLETFKEDPKKNWKFVNGSLGRTSIRINIKDALI